MTDPKDHAFMGHFIESFNTAILTALPNSHFLDPTAAFIFKLSSGSLRVIKLTRKIIERLRGEIKAALEYFPEADQKDYLKRALRDEAFVQANLEMILTHPISIHLENIPDAPCEIRDAHNYEYVKFIHVNAYQNIFKFDITFLDGSAERFSMASSVVMYFLESIDGACSILSELSNSQ